MIPLRASGYRVNKGGGHHKRAIESLPLTVGMEFRDISDQIEIASRRRGQAMYDHVGVVEERDAEVLIQTATKLRNIVMAFLARKYPNLMSR